MPPGVQTGSGRTVPAIPRERFVSISMGFHSGRKARSASERLVEPSRKAEAHLLDLPLGVQALQIIIERMILPDEQRIYSQLVPLHLKLAQLGILGAHGFEQSRGVDEREESDSLPDHLFTVHVDLELLRVEIDDGRVVLGHERLEGEGKVDSTVARVL